MNQEQSLDYTAVFNRLFNKNHGMPAEAQVGESNEARNESACGLCGGELVEENTSSSFVHLDMNGEQKTCLPCVDDYYERLFSE